MPRIARQKDSLPETPTAPNQPATDPQRGAAIIRDLSGPSVLHALAGPGLGQLVGVDGFKEFLDRFQQDLRTSTSPLEAILLQEMLFAHARVGTLHVQSLKASSPELTAIYSSAAVQLTAEVRRLSLAIKQLQTPAGTPQLAVQQNVAITNSTAAVAEEGYCATLVPENNGRQNELASNDERGYADVDERPATDAATGRREEEPNTFERLNGRWAGGASRFGAAEPAVALVNGSANGHG